METKSTGPEGGTVSSYIPGKFVVRPINYTGPSRSSVRTCELKIREGARLSEIITATTGAGLNDSKFVRRGNGYWGCHNFM